METSNLKNTVILKSIPSNIIEQAISVLKKNIKIKEFELQNKRKTESTTEKKEQNQDYIIKEAEMIINNYCNKIENNQKKEKILKSIQKKNKRMKKYLLILMIISIIEMIIIVLK